eukprot:1944046-Pyramimonas_sp.AAC.1
MAKHLEAESRPPPLMSTHANMQTVHNDVQHWDAKVEKDLQRPTKAKEQVVEFDKALRESRTQLAS